MRHNVAPIADNKKVAEPLFDLSCKMTVQHTRATESVSENAVFKISAVEHAEFMAEESDSRAVRISADHNLFHGRIHDIRAKMVFNDFPDAQKSAVGVPSVFHIAIGFCGKVKVVIPIGFSVAPFKKDIQRTAVHVAVIGGCFLFKLYIFFIEKCLKQFGQRHDDSFPAIRRGMRSFAVYERMDVMCKKGNTGHVAGISLRNSAPRIY